MRDAVRPQCSSMLEHRRSDAAKFIVAEQQDSKGTTCKLTIVAAPPTPCPKTTEVWHLVIWNLLPLWGTSPAAPTAPTARLHSTRREPHQD